MSITTTEVFNNYTTFIKEHLGPYNELSRHVGEAMKMEIPENKKYKSHVKNVFGGKLSDKSANNLANMLQIIVTMPIEDVVSLIAINETSSMEDEVRAYLQSLRKDTMVLPTIQKGGEDELVPVDALDTRDEREEERKRTYKQIIIMLLSLFIGLLFLYLMVVSIENIVNSTIETAYIEMGDFMGKIQGALPDSDALIEGETSMLAIAPDTLPKEVRVSFTDVISSALGYGIPSQLVEVVNGITQEASSVITAVLKKSASSGFERAQKLAMTNLGYNLISSIATALGYGGGEAARGLVTKGIETATSKAQLLFTELSFTLNEILGDAAYNITSTASLHVSLAFTAFISAILNGASVILTRLPTEQQGPFLERTNRIVETLVTPTFLLYMASEKSLKFIAGKAFNMLRSVARLMPGAPRAGPYDEGEEGPLLLEDVPRGGRRHKSRRRSKNKSSRKHKSKKHIGRKHKKSKNKSSRKHRKPKRKTIRKHRR